MSNKQRCGLLTQRDYKFRLVLSVTTILLGAYIHWGFYPVAGFLLYSIYFGFCPIKRILTNNQDQYYIAKFPQNNPSPVVAYNFSGDVLFKNNEAISRFEDIDILDPIKGYLTEEKFENADIRWIQGENIWIVTLRILLDENIIFAYFKDITEISRIQEEIIRTQKDIVYAMGEIGETRSKETGNHVKRVAEYSYLLASLYGLPQEEAEIIRTASPMHDIGKVGIPDSILKKPGKLELKEFEEMKKHTTIGFELLKNSNRPILKAASIISNEHHEKWDGTGYPRGLRGDEIHLYGRITALADVFDALGSERVYKKAWELKDILNLIKENRGSHFDPDLVDIFLNNIDSFIEIRDKLTDIKT